VTLAEACRGLARTRRAEAAIARDRGGQRILVVPTDIRLAKLVGAVLHGAGHGSESMADAHVIAVCAGVDAAVVNYIRLTTSPNWRVPCQAPVSSHALLIFESADG
jgi:hypothetical protein